MDEKGYLDPIVYGCEINFGESTIKNTDQTLEFFYHGLLEFSKVMIQNSAYFFGEYMFTNLLGPMVDEFTNHYMLPFMLVN